MGKKTLISRSILAILLIGLISFTFQNCDSFQTTEKVNGSDNIIRQIPGSLDSQLGPNGGGYTGIDGKEYFVDRDSAYFSKYISNIEGMTCDGRPSHNGILMQIGTSLNYDYFINSCDEIAGTTTQVPSDWRDDMYVFNEKRLQFIQFNNIVYVGGVVDDDGTPSNEIYPLIVCKKPTENMNYIKFDLVIFKLKGTIFMMFDFVKPTSGTPTGVSSEIFDYNIGFTESAGIIHYYALNSFDLIVNSSNAPNGRFQSRIQGEDVDISLDCFIYK